MIAQDAETKQPVSRHDPVKDWALKDEHREHRQKIVDVLAGAPIARPGCGT
jgi:hypothetical protein